MAVASGIRAGALLVAEELADDLILDAEAFVAVGYEMLRRQEDEREEERPEDPVRVKNYAETIVPMYSQEDFKKHFRMQRETVEDLCRLLAPYLPSRILPVYKKVLATLWLLGNLESFRGVADRFDLGKSSLHSILHDVCGALRAVRNTVIVWPTENQLPQLAVDFLRKTNMPGVIGAIDGTHIRIPGPSDHRDAYINRKGFPSIQLQAVCDSNLRFLDIFTGWPGSTHDARVFRNSPLHTLLENGNLPREYHLLGDSAYPLDTYMIVPYRDDGHLLPWQRHFNFVHSSARVVIERAFGLLKCKFRRLLKLEMYNVHDIPLIVSGACVLHNIILLRENLDADLQELHIEPQDEAENVGERPPRGAAVEKRDQLANYMARFM